MFVVFLILLSVGFVSGNKEFFDQVAIDRTKGAEWHYVGSQALDPTAKSIPLQCVETDDNGNTTPCGDPYIIYKLKMSDDGTH